MMQKITDCLVKNNKQFLLAFLFIVLFSVENIAAIYLSTGGFAYPTFFLKFVVKFFFFNCVGKYHYTNATTNFILFDCIY